VCREGLKGEDAPVVGGDLLERVLEAGNPRRALHQIRRHRDAPGGDQDIDRARVGRMSFAAPVALQNLGALILRHHPLHLQQQLVFWSLSQLPVEEHHLDAGMLQLIDQQHLIGILARQPIGRVDIEAVHSPDGHRIA
jgi:hypothetical protein